MNIFFLAADPRRNAACYCDVHVVKIILEICQMLFIAHHALQQDETWKRGPKRIYRAVFANRAICIWVRQTRSNYMYAVTLGVALCREYTLRYGRTHACQPLFAWLEANPPPDFGAKPNEGFVSSTSSTTRFAASGNPVGCTPVPLTMPPQFYDSDLIVAYQNYYRIYKPATMKRGMRWRFRPVPKFFLQRP